METLATMNREQLVKLHGIDGKRADEVLAARDALQPPAGSLAT